ncbi:MAG TPA: D-lyxose/D-mannose family sugar isomerase [Candidatus Sumerlaeota bacterium]|nr:D-lyxose/D-mannose family sugar isomerase [Candidatus Sumerlaeota bacterium]HPK02083.1 D-lyxose/D-mannose family sugar isomerase [Candidatus Sumerlaeota bacterium]
MKRSTINRYIRATEAFFAERQFHLPDFGHWTPEDWRQKGPETREIAECQLGWDVTDFGLGDFEKTGLVAFTVRNGLNQQLSAGGKPYCEKIMRVGEAQVTPWHFHWNKMEDIINRGGGNLIIAVANVSEDEGLAGTPVELSIDGVRHTVPARTEVSFAPGQSLTIPPYLYHAFWAEPGSGPVLCGEVSKVNDDHHDNRFLKAIRFSEIEEDESPYRLIVGDYERYYSALSS